MAVDVAVSREMVRRELPHVRELARLHGWSIEEAPSGLSLVVTMRAHTGDVFVPEVDCENYREWPPLIEFLDPETRQKGAAHAYPKSTDSLFHSSGPCVCAPFNRKAYKSFFQSGPHSDWEIGNWAASTANGFNWVNVSTLADMLGLIQTRLSRQDLYRGRMG